MGLYSFLVFRLQIYTLFLFPLTKSPNIFSNHRGRIRFYALRAISKVRTFAHSPPPQPPVPVASACRSRPAGSSPQPPRARHVAHHVPAHIRRHRPLILAARSRAQHHAPSYGCPQELRPPLRDVVVRQSVDMQLNSGHGL